MRANNPPWTKTWQGTLKDALINISQSAFINNDNNNLRDLISIKSFA